MSAPQVSLLPDGRRLHLNHGPIDLIVQAMGDTRETILAYEQAAARFQTILTELVAELPRLRQAAGRSPRKFSGVVARRMEAAVCPHAGLFITPMAAVAGAVADEVLGALVTGRKLAKAYVNNGGDIALYLAAGEMLTAGVVADTTRMDGRAVVRARDPIRGIATSGWRGRSFSLGIADAVTVMARTATEADAAATVIANAVDLPGHLSVRRDPASSLAPDSDLGARLVTTGVGVLRDDDVEVALSRGVDVAEHLCREGLIVSAALQLQGQWRVTGPSFERSPTRMVELEQAL
jgi:uncharacterized protein